MTPMPLEDPNGRRIPRLPGRLTIRDDTDRTIDALLADLFIHANNCVRAFGDFQLAVSATPQSEPILMRLMYDPPYRDFPWGRTRLWMTDELDVAPDHVERRATRLAETIVALSGMPESQFHVLEPGGLERYGDQLREHLGWREKGHDRLDCVLLTLDASGCLSAVGEQTAPQGQRVTVPTPFLDSARFIAIYGAGEAKTAALERIESVAKARRLGIMPIGGELVWYVSRDSVDSGVPLV